MHLFLFIDDVDIIIKFDFFIKPKSFLLNSQLYLHKLLFYFRAPLYW